MLFEYYLFAFYVFLLICATIWFFGRIMRGDRKKDKGGYEKEQRLFKMYQNIEDMLASFEEYAEEAKAGIDERIKQAEALMEKSRGSAEAMPAPELKPASAAPADAAAPAEDVQAGKTQKKAASGDRSRKKAEELIPQYIAKGMSKEQIAAALGISTREVSLIIEVKNITENG